MSPHLFSRSWCSDDRHQFERVCSAAARRCCAGRGALLSSYLCSSARHASHAQIQDGRRFTHFCQSPTIADMITGRQLYLLRNTSTTASASFGKECPFRREISFANRKLHLSSPAPFHAHTASVHITIVEGTLEMLMS